MPFIKDMSLYAKLVLGGMLMSLLPLVIVGATTYINSSRTLEGISQIQLTQLARGLAGMTDNILGRNMKILAAIAEDPVIIQSASNGEFGSLDQKMGDLYKKVAGDYEDIVVCDREGIIRSDGVDAKRKGIDVSDRDYFQAIKNGQAGIGTPVISKATNEPIFGMSVPIISATGEFVGGVLGVVKTDLLVKQLSSIKMGKTGYSYMLNRQGVIIAHPDRKMVLSFDVNTNEDMKNLAGRAVRQEEGVEEYVQDKEMIIAGISPLKSTGWIVVVSQNKDEVMALAYVNRNLISVVSLLSLFMTLLAFRASRTISRPVENKLTTLNQAIDQAKEAIFIVDVDRKVQFVNPAMANIVDRSVADLIDKESLLAETLRIDKKEIWETVENGNVWTGIIESFTRDSTSFSMNITITPVRNKEGVISCFLGIGRDITKELYMEEQIRQGQKMEAIGTLAGGIAHDFNNILSAIFGLIDLALVSLTDREKTMYFLKETRKAADRAKDLVSQILAFSRQSEHGQHPVIPRHIIKEALKLLRASLPSTIQIQELMKSTSFVLGDPTQIQQVIMNLCTNANHAMKGRGGILRVVLEDVQVDESLSVRHPGLVPGTYLKLDISDTGPGIPSAVIDRIFDPFFTTKPQGEGTGLGLSVVHGIVKTMNGFISVDSEMDKGTTFTIYLPVVQGKENFETKENDFGDIQGGSERILLVDDEDTLIMTGSMMFENLGYEVISFTQSIQAWNAFRNDPEAFDVVVTDYTMPFMTGYELAKKIRAIRKDIPIIICSGYIDKTMEKLMQEIEINEFIGKPITKENLAQAVRKVLDHNIKS
jgi:PAS domain S-box-containing protein